MRHLLLISREVMVQVALEYRRAHSNSTAGAGLALGQQNHTLMRWLGVCPLMHLPVIPQGSKALEQKLPGCGVMACTVKICQHSTAQHCMLCLTACTLRLRGARYGTSIVADKVKGTRESLRHRIPCHATAAMPRSK